MNVLFIVRDLSLSKAISQLAVKYKTIKFKYKIFFVLYSICYLNAVHVDYIIDLR